MATTVQPGLRSGGLHHASSLSNIEASSKGHYHFPGRSYDSEDENMGRTRAHTTTSTHFLKTSIYSRGDIKEQYCLSDRQLSSIEPPRRERFFGCWSGRGAPQSFLGVCVGRRAPSDENIHDYAPIYKYPRYPPPGPVPHDILLYDEDLENSYFRRRPTSFLTGGDPKRYTWMPADEEAVRLEGPRPICPEDDFMRGPYVVGSYPPKTEPMYLSQSTEHLARMYHCPSHIGIPPPPPPPIVPTDGAIIDAPRTKHVSFARSHTLTSFDEAMGMRPLSRMGSTATRSQERLIGGKKPTITLSAQQLPPTHTLLLQQPQPPPPPPQQEIVVVEKIKRGAMKTQATQTEVCLGKKPLPPHHLSLSPRTIHRVRMVSQGAQTNGMNGRTKLTKSLSEAATRQMGVGITPTSPLDIPQSPGDHEPLHRTQSEEPPRSPFSLITPPLSHLHADIHSRTSSRQSQLETSRSDIFSSENIFTHSRNHSQDSAVTSKASQDSISMVFEPAISRQGQLEPVHQQWDGGYGYESHSLPRRTCIHHRGEERTTSTLPRRDHQHHVPCGHVTIGSTEMLNGGSGIIPESILKGRRSSVVRDSSTESNAPSERLPRRMSSYVPVQETHAQLRRASHHVISPEIHSLSRRSSAKPPPPASEEFCSTCESESDSKTDREEKEIFIDFKPNISPISSPQARKKRLQKTLSEGEILLEKRRESTLDIGMGMMSASDEDINAQLERQEAKEHYQYRSSPIKDEGICNKQNLLTIPQVGAEKTLRYTKESFRKRSISLEDPTILEAGTTSGTGTDKSTPPSPCPDGLSVQGRSAFPSSDSIAADLTRDHSDGIWNESQITVLTNEQSPSDSGPSLLTPTTRRKNLILQHQQRSSMDTDALELEQEADQAPVIVTMATAMTQTSSSAVPIEALSKASWAGARPSISTCSAAIGPTPSIAVTPSLSMEQEEKSPRLEIRRTSRTLSPSLRREVRKSSLQFEISPHTHRRQESPEQNGAEHGSRMEIAKNSTDISEGSTNTEDYITCTDNSKRAQGIKMSGASSSSTTQVPVSAQSSQTATVQDGSSFESASSIYSLARGDAVCDDTVVVDEQKLSPTPTSHSMKHSPAHSVSSSSSGSYSLKDFPRTKTSPSRAPKGAAAAAKPKHESISDDERSEKRYSSSGYYESPHEDGAEVKVVRGRRSRDWNDEERRRKKGTMKLDFDKDAAAEKTYTSPHAKSGAVFKQISPDDRTALNILDGTSPSKAKRFRPKTRRSPRNRSASGEDTLIRRIKTPAIRSPEQTPATHVATKISPSKYPTMSPHQPPYSPTGSPRKHKELSPGKRLKALSTESLRSVSPGSDSVFYSEADAMSEHQVHCHHCGKEVEIITAAAGSQESLRMVEDERAEIVQPPAGFADSPDGVRAPHHTRLYKKLDKRFRSEERHGDRRHYRNRTDTRAKSEERGKEEVPKSVLRPAGSSPCVVPVDDFNPREQQADPEQGIYHGFYRLGTWICIANRDVWRRHDGPTMEVRFSDQPRELTERRGSTESEKDFKKKYQAITHRLVHRRSCVEMYRRQSINSFDTDKTVVVCRDSGEFGFRIHGSKPVVVSAIEPDTPAESSGLEVGDIVLSVNGISVIDKSHSEVVKIAHAGSDTLELEVARTIGMLSANGADNAAIYSGYLLRQSGYASGNVNAGKWVRRWFTLRPDHCLYFYKTDGDSQPVGAILLTNHRVEHCSSNEVGKQFAFRIEGPEAPPLILAADTEDAVNRWVAVMSHASQQSDPWLEVSTRNLRLSPNCVPRPDCFGYLLKLGSRWRGWSKRYCVLKDACMYFYHDSNSKSAFGMACLQGYRVQPTSTAGGKKYAFEVAPPEPKLRHYYFSTETEMDKKRWVAALEYSIDRWMKAG
ncbi:uncharacterized protein LOC129791033 isoform X2 [Lutzomyia longipalpis]|nr:uncharacterized protein LOC129791033 isoform X2 [Lutzomyia longipalpis]